MISNLVNRWLLQRFNTLLIGALLGLSLLGASSAFARSYDDVMESGYIEVALYQQFPPYSYLDDNDEPTGLDVDVAKKIAENMGVDIRWLWIAPDETAEDDFRNAIWKGRKIDRRKADIMMRAPFDSRFSYGIDGYGLPRNELVIMFAPYHTEHWSIARDLEKVGEARNLAVFRFEKVGVEIDTLPDTYLLSAYRGTLQKNVKHFHNFQDAASAMIEGDLAAIVGMHTQVVWSLGEHAKQYDIDDDGLAEMGPGWMIGIAARHEFRQLSHVINRIVEEMIFDNTMQGIVEKYGAEYKVPEYYN